MKRMLAVTMSILLGLQNVYVTPAYGQTVEADAQVAGETLAESAQILTLDTEVNVELAEGEEVFYKFVPDTSGMYAFSTTGDSDTVGILLDADGEQLKYNDDGADNTDEDGNFCIEYELNAGVTYYLQLYIYDYESGNCTLKVESSDKTFVASTKDKDISMDMGESETLEVETEFADGTLNYQWYYYDEATGENVLINGATQNTYQVDGDENVKKTYVCVVSDGTTTQNVNFNMHVDSGLTVGEDQEVTIAPGETKSLTVTAENGVGELTYQWYYYDYDEEQYVIIDGATTSSYDITGSILMEDDYMCEVSDDFMSCNVFFDVTLETGLIVTQSDEIIPMSYGESTTLSVSATGGSGDITYQWYSYNEEEALYDAIETATTNTYNITANGSTYSSYCCVVEDDYIEKSCYFYPVIDTGLTVTQSGTKVSVEYNGTATLSVSASGGAGSLSYQWYAYENGQYTTISGETSNSYTVTGNSSLKDKYCCEVSDGVMTKTVYFYTTLDTGLTVGETEQYIYVVSGQNATLTVEATGGAGSLSYQWYDCDEDTDSERLMNGATDNSCQITGNADTKTSYICEVSDGVLTKRVTFYVTVMKIVDYTLGSTVNVDCATVDDTQKTAYKFTAGTNGWYELCSTGDSDPYIILLDEQYQKLGENDEADNETDDNNFSLQMLLEAGKTYYAVVGYYYVGDTMSLSTASADFGAMAKDSVVTVQEGTTGQLEATAYTSSGNLSYQWYIYDEEEAEYVIIDGATQSTYSVDGSKDAQYKCIVSNGTKEVELNFTVETTPKTTDDSDDTNDTDDPDDPDDPDNPDDTENETFDISTDCNVVLAYTACTYDGTAKTPGVTVTKDTQSLVNGTDYEVSYMSNTNAGTAIVMVTGKGVYTGLVTKTFTIQALTIATDEVSLSQTTYTYDGTAKTPEVTVTVGSKTLVKGTDYVVSYLDNVDAGNATATVTGKGNYTGNITKTFIIRSVSITTDDITLSQSTYSYDGSAKTPEVTVTVGSKTLINGTDYEVSYTNNVNVGDATVTITGKGNYTQTITKTFTIQAASITADEVTLSQDTYTYDGSAKMPEVTVKKGTNTLVKDTDYEVSYSGNTNVGTAIVTVSGKGNYTETITKTFTIQAASITADEVTLSQDTYTYDGSAKTPEVTVKKGTNTLVKGTDYVVSYADNVNVGSATVTISGKGNYTQTITKTFTIQAASIAEENITLSQDTYLYDGSAKMPDVIVIKGGKLLNKGTDYDVNYADNINVGDASVTITAKGNYDGEITKYFSIVEEALTIVMNEDVTLAAEVYTYDGTAKTPEVTVTKDGEILVNGTDYEVSYTSNTEVGTATVTITGKGSYTGTITKTFVIQAATITADEVTLSQTTYTYDGSAKTPDVFVTKNEISLVCDTDYEVSYVDNTNVGTATVTITGKGNYTGNITKTFTIQAISITTEEVTLSQDTYTYDGSAKTPEVTVTKDGKTLVNGTDYEVSYASNIEVGTATVTITGTGNYVGSITKTFTIRSITITNQDVTLSQEIYTYDGTEKTPEVTVTKDGKTLESGTDYDVSYENNLDAGTATVTITGKGNYAGTVTKTFTIEEELVKEITKEDIVLSGVIYTYDGTAKIPEVTVAKDGNILVKGTDYDVSYEDNTEVGTATVTITGKGDYKGTVIKTFTIRSATITEKDVTLSADTYTYDGSAKTPEVTITKDGVTLAEGTDYEVSYDNNTNVGTATVTIKGKGNYMGTVTKTFTIQEKADDGSGDDQSGETGDGEDDTRENGGSTNDNPTTGGTTSQTPTTGGTNKNPTTGGTVNKTPTSNATSKKTTTVNKTNTTQTSQLKVGSVYTVGSYKYKVTGANTVTFVGTTNKNLTKVNIAKTVKIGGKTFKITAIANNALAKMKKLKKVTIGANVTTIGKKAFFKCSKLKNIIIKSQKLKAVGKQALKGINKKAKIKVPSKKLKAYKKLFKGKGQAGKVKITK